MDYNKAALEMHETHKGKIAIAPKVSVKTRDDLSTAYTPGVAEPCRRIAANKNENNLFIVFIHFSSFSAIKKRLCFITKSQKIWFFYNFMLICLAEYSLLAQDRMDF